MAKSSKQLLNELQQQQDFQAREEEAVVALLRTVDHIRRATSSVLEAYEVTLQQYNVLRILRGAGEEGLPILEVGKRMVEQSPGITRLIDRLEDKELIARERSRMDRRQINVTITQKGLALLEKMDKPVRDTDRKLMENLSEEDIEKLISLLDAIRS